MLSPEAFSNHIHSLPEAPSDFVKAKQAIVRNAMSRLQYDGEICSNKNVFEQRITLFDENSRRLYHVVDMAVVIRNRQIESVGDLASGLEITGYQLTSGNQIKEPLGNLHLPRDQFKCDKDRNYEDMNPSSFIITADELLKAKYVPNSIMEKARRLYVRFDQARRERPFEIFTETLGKI